jgi:hypothetical protein
MSNLMSVLEVMGFLESFNGDDDKIKVIQRRDLVSVLPPFISF